MFVKSIFSHCSKNILQKPMQKVWDCGIIYYLLYHHIPLCAYVYKKTFSENRLKGGTQTAYIDIA